MKKELPKECVEDWSGPIFCEEKNKCEQCKIEENELTRVDQTSK